MAPPRGLQKGISVYKVPLTAAFLSPCIFYHASRKYYAQKVIKDYESQYSSLDPILDVLFAGVIGGVAVGVAENALGVDIFATVAKFLDDPDKDKTAPITQKPNKPFTIGILGAGAAGLYTALMIDYLNEDEPSGVTYEILEGNNRAGGRLYTHVFEGKDTTPNDYYVSLPMSWCYIIAAYLSHLGRWSYEIPRHSDHGTHFQALRAPRTL